MSNAPPLPVEIPNYTNYQPDQEVFRLRRRLGDLLRLGAATPETFQQTLMQLWNENERRRQSCLQEAEEHLRKYHSLVAQAHAFSAQSSIVYSIVNGYVTIEERRLQELADREREKAAEAAAETAGASVEQLSDETGVEGADTSSVEATKPAGGRRKKP